MKGQALTLLTTEHSTNRYGQVQVYCVHSYSRVVIPSGQVYVAASLLLQKQPVMPTDSEGAGPEMRPGRRREEKNLLFLFGMKPRFLYRPGHCA